MDFTDMDRLLAEVNTYRPLAPEAVARLRDDFLVEYTYNTNAIEGSTLTLNETMLVLNEGITVGGKPLKDHLDAIGHRDAYGYMEELVQHGTGLTERVIKELHSLVLMSNQRYKGVYRDIPVRVGDHTPPQPYLVAPEMEQLLRRYHGEMANLHTVERAALFHLEFETIHPFIDGNGRTGRLLLNFELVKNGYPPIDVKFADRTTYYGCFDQYRMPGGSPDAMTDLVAGYVRERLEWQLEILRSLEPEGPAKPNPPVR